MSVSTRAWPGGGADHEHLPGKAEKARALGVTSATGLVIGSVVGTCVFVMPAVLAKAGTSSILTLGVIAAGPAWVGYADALFGISPSGIGNWAIALSGLWVPPRSTGAAQDGLFPAPFAWTDRKDSACARLAYLASGRRRVQGWLLTRDLSIAGAAVLFSMWVTFAVGYQAVYQALVVVLGGVVPYALVKARRERLGQVPAPVDNPAGPA